MPSAQERTELRKLGYPDQEIDGMSPERVRQLIQEGRHADRQHGALSGGDQGHLGSSGGQKAPSPSEVQPNNPQPPHPTSNPSGVIHGGPGSDKTG